VFSVTPPASPGGSWSEAVLYSFTGGTAGPSSVAAGAGGVLFGATYYDGTSSEGTIYKLKP
jgi:uncharacterized repeat protein (TIGR03803 family)